MTDPLFFIRSSLEAATPLVLAAMGGVLSERSGVINFALEGMILAGALAGALVAGPGDCGVIWGLSAAAAAGALLALIHALAATRLGADQIVSSVAINLFALGFTGVLYDRMRTIACPTMGTMALLGTSPLLPITAFVVMWTWFRLNISPRGLAVRAAGEDPQSAWLAGVNVTRVRIISVTLGGVFAGLAGGYLTLGVTGEFRPEMSAGRGFIAIACIVCGGWRPLRVAGVAVAFGALLRCADALQQFSWIRGGLLDLVQALPFFLTVLMLGLKPAHEKIPAGLGKSVNK